MRWPDWAVLWADRAWVIELKTEAANHGADQLRYDLRLAAAAHPRCNLYLTYITGPPHQAGASSARGPAPQPPHLGSGPAADRGGMGFGYPL